MSDFNAPPPPPPPEDRGRSGSSDHDPYAMGQPHGGDPASYGHTGPPREALAGFWIRFGAAFIDGLILGVVGGILGAGNRGFSLLGVVIAGAYFTYFHASAAGQTVGNKVCNIRVADEANGATLDYGRAAIRWLMSYVSGFALLIGYLWMLGDANKQTWHDKVARSVVVQTRHSPPPGAFGQPASTGR